MIRLSIVSPCYNEESVIEESASRLAELLCMLVEKQKISSDSFVLYVNDGSKDQTWELIKSIHASNPMIRGLRLACNVGHQNAIMAGMMKVRTMCDAVITIDADLQDDLNAIEKMIDLYEQGNDVVYGVKVSRQADPLAKRVSAQLFYKLQQSMGVETIYNHADFRLVSRKTLGILAQYPERNLYLRGVIAKMGLKSATVEDVLSDRMAGESKYTLRKMLKLALDGITSFTTRPIDLIVGMGVVMMLVSLLMMCHVLYAWAKGDVVPGWSELMISVWFIGSAILLAIGVVGEYIGKIYTETKQRPLYVEDEYLA